MESLPDTSTIQQQLLEERAVHAVQEGGAFISNVEQVLSDQPVTNGYAQKVREVSQRALWYPGYGYLVLPEQPNPDFMAYVGAFGLKPDIIVPEGLNPGNLSMRHWFAGHLGLLKHPAAGRKHPQTAVLYEAFNNNVAESYVADQALSLFVTASGGGYAGGHPKDKAKQANDKARFAEFAEGIIQTPTGTLHTGIHAITDAVYKRLKDSQDTFIRHTQSGGGFGNRSFTHQGTKRLSKRAIRTRIAGDQPELWESATALVEEHLGHIMYSPAVSFDWSGFTFDNLQLTGGGNYHGCISPVPLEVVDAEILQNIGSSFAASVRAKTNYLGPGNLDMGIPQDGRLIGFECNARFTGARHAIAIGELLVGPWRRWRANNDVALSVDHFTLRERMQFEHLYDILDGEGLLASKSHPQGVVISIPPHDRVAGIHVQAKGYSAAVEQHDEVVRLVGDPEKNIYDNSLHFAA